MTNERYLISAIRASVEAGEAILDVYGTDFDIVEKADKSPLTLADKRSHEIIKNELEKFDIPILSEEGRDISYPERSAWERLWVVDPLDGTKEFIKRNDEFTVNIALVENGEPIMGVILVPVMGLLYFAERTLGSFKISVDKIDLQGNLSVGEMIESSKQLKRSNVSKNLNQTESLTGAEESPPYTIVGSRSHATPELEAFVEKKRKKYKNVEFVSAGSSLKFCLVAEGKADIYPRLGPTMEWDTAAGHAIAENSGAAVYCYDTNDLLSYNKDNLLNPWFVVERGAV